MDSCKRCNGSPIYILECHHAMHTTRCCHAVCRYEAIYSVVYEILQRFKYNQPLTKAALRPGAALQAEKVLS